MAQTQEPALNVGMLQHSGEEQRADSQVSETVEKFPGEICCHMELTESKCGGTDPPVKDTGPGTVTDFFPVALSFLCSEEREQLTLLFLLKYNLLKKKQTPKQKTYFPFGVLSIRRRSAQDLKGLPDPQSHHCRTEEVFSGSSLLNMLNSRKTPEESAHPHL